MEINDEIKAYLTIKFAEEIDESPEGLELSDDDIFDMLYDNIVYEEEDADDDFVLVVSAVSQIGDRYFQYYYSYNEAHYNLIDARGIEEVEPYENIVIAYKPINK